MCTYPVWGRHVWWQYPHSEWLVLHCGSSDRQQTSWTWHADHVAFQIQQPHNPSHRSPWWIEVHHNKPCQAITRNFTWREIRIMLHIFDERFGPLKLTMSNNYSTKVFTCKRVLWHLTYALRVHQSACTEEIHTGQ